MIVPLLKIAIRRYQKTGHQLLESPIVKVEPRDRHDSHAPKIAINRNLFNVIGFHNSPEISVIDQSATLLGHLHVSHLDLGGTSGFRRALRRSGV
jgi:hypothetical protein